MIIRQPKPDANRSKEVKVIIPVDHLVRLHSMKVLTGKHISDTVTEALNEYFARQNAQMHRHGLEVAPGMEP